MNFRIDESDRDTLADQVVDYLRDHPEEVRVYKHSRGYVKDVHPHFVESKYS